MSASPNQPLEDALRRTCRLDEHAASPAAIARARDLARLLPQPSEGGLRAWFDRAIASIARPTFTESAQALEGVRRLAGPRARGWEGASATVELELEPIAISGQSAAYAVCGQVSTRSGEPISHVPVAVVAADGSLLEATHTDDAGYFALQVPSHAAYMSLALQDEFLLLDDVLGEGRAEGKEG